MKSFFIKRLRRRPGLWFPVALMLSWVPSAWPDKMPEYELKAGFLYSFIPYTEWPARVGETLNLCDYGQNPFGDYLDDLQGKKVVDRHLKVWSLDKPDRLDRCQIVFIARTADDNLEQVLNKVKGKPVLTVADTPGAARRWVALNMSIRENRVIFEANLAAARANGLDLSSRLLRLATDVIR